MSEPALINQLIEGMLAQRDSSVTSTFVGATPFPQVLWFSLSGYLDKVIQHTSTTPRTHKVSIPVATLAPGVRLYRSRATVHMGMFRHINDPSTWRMWDLTNAQVQEDSTTHQITVQFDLLLDGDNVAAGSFNFTADLYLGF